MPLAEQRGGGEMTLLHLIEHGRGRGIDWTVAFLNDGPMVGTVRNWSVSAIVVDAGRLRQPHRFAAAIVKLRSIIKTRSIDIVLSWMGKAHLYGGTAATLAGVPAAWYQQGLPSSTSWQQLLVNRIPACVVLACSQSVATAQSKIRPHRPICTVHPGVDLSWFDPAKLPTPAECRLKLSLPPTGPLIGIVGRLQRWKGMHHLVDAMPAILAKHPDAHAVIVGGEHALEPDYPAFLKVRIDELNLQDAVILTGIQANVPEWMQAMDVVVHASDSEPFGLVVIEAMALGKPVVATNLAGPAEIITDGVNGLLWSAGNIEQLSEKALRCLDLSTGTVLNENARRRAIDFSVQAYASRVCEVIAGQVVDSPAQSEPATASLAS